MSDIMLNLNYDDSAQRRPGGEKKKKSKGFYKKLHRLRRKGYGEGKHKNNHRTGQSGPNQAHPRPNGVASEHPSLPTSSQYKSLPHPSSITSSSNSSSNPSTSHQRPVNSTTTNTPHPTSVSSGRKQTSTGIPTKYLALDCEMVGTGPKGSISQLARCSIVSYDGDVVYDKFINPPMPVTDYRTRWSGIRRSDLAHATPYTEARKEILRLLMGKVVIGHAVHNDFKVLGYTHPAAQTRDTSRIPLLNRKAGFGDHECASLKRLTKAIFNRDIQTGRKGHSSVEDARATMELYKAVEEEWERELASRSQAS